MRRIAVAILAIALAACQSSVGQPGATSEDAADQDSTNGPAELDTVTLRLDWFVNGSNSVYHLAKEKGFYEDEGIDLQIGDGKGSVSTAQVVGSGGDMFGIADVSTAAITADEGAEVTAVASFVRTSPLCITVLESSGISDLEGLQGKSIGVPTAGFASLFLPAVLEAGGMSMDDIEAVQIDATAKIQALAEGRVDGVADLTLSAPPVLEIQLGKPVNLIEYADYGIQVLSTGLIVHNGVLETDPDLVARMVRATIKGWQYAIEHPDETAAMAVKQQPELQEEVALVQLERSVENHDTPNTEGKPFGWMPEADWEATAELLKQYLDMSPDADITSFYTNEFIPDSP